MAYNKTAWQDHIVDGGNVIQEGTPISANNLNKIETGIEAAHANDFATDLLIGKRTIQNPTADAGTSNDFITALFNLFTTAIRAIRLTLSTHTHEVTKVQVGLGNVENIQQATKEEFNVHNNDANRHITPSERTVWGGKQDALGFTPENITNKNQANGYAGTDENNRVNDTKNLNGAAASEYAKKSEGIFWGTGIWSGSTLNVTVDTRITALTTGLGISVKIPSDSPANPLININNISAKTILKSDGTQPKAKALKGIIQLRYDGTNFYLVGEGGEEYQPYAQIIDATTTWVCPHTGVYNITCVGGGGSAGGIGLYNNGLGYSNAGGVTSFGVLLTANGGGIGGTATGNSLGGDASAYINYGVGGSGGAGGYIYKNAGGKGGRGVNSQAVTNPQPEVGTINAGSGGSYQTHGEKGKGYGAGGGGAFGSGGSGGGQGGRGGNSGYITTGSFTIVEGTVITITIGVGGTCQGTYTTAQNNGSNGVVIIEGSVPA